MKTKLITNRYNLVFYWLFMLIFCISCSMEREQKKVVIDLLGETIDSLKYSMFVDSIEYIDIELTDSCLIGKIADMDVCRDHLFIFDEQQQVIWHLNREGRYLNKICKQGGGPDEYTYINHFEYDEKRNQIVVLAPWQQALLFYTPEGKYLKTVKLGMKADDFKISPQGGFILSNSGSDEPAAGIYYVNDYGQEMKCLVKRKNNHLVYLTFEWELCSYGDIINFMAPNFDNTVYHFRNQELSAKYFFSMKPELKHNYKKSVSLQKLEDFIRTSYLEGEKWIWATYWSPGDGLRIFIYSKDNENYWISKIIVNDLDNKDIGRKTSITDNNTFVTWSENEDADKNPVIGILHLK